MGYFTFFRLLHQLVPLGQGQNVHLWFRILVSLFTCLLLLTLPVDAQVSSIDSAVYAALSRASAEAGYQFEYRELGRTVDAESGGVVYLQLVDRESGEPIPGLIDWAYVRPLNGWQVYLPGDFDYQTAFNALPDAVVNQFDSSPYRTFANPALVDEDSLANYRFPWEEAAFATVTRSYNEHGRGAIDFDLTARNITAAKAGTVVFAVDRYEANAFLRGAWWYWNVVIIQHGPHEFSLYGHLLPDSIPAEIKATCVEGGVSGCNFPVESGDFIGQEGSSGTSTNPHLHFETAQNWYTMTYPDLLDDDGDNDRREPITTAYLYQEQNVGLSGYTPEQVAAWEWGSVFQATHRPQLAFHDNLLVNGDFSDEMNSWHPSGQINWAVQDGVMRATRLRTNAEPQWARFYQDFPGTWVTGSLVHVTALLGNDSANEKQVTFSLINPLGRQYGEVSCTFDLAPNQLLRGYHMHFVLPASGAGLRLEIEVTPPDGSPAVLIDNIRLHRDSAWMDDSADCEPQP